MALISGLAQVSRVIHRALVLGLTLRLNSHGRSSPFLWGLMRVALTSLPFASDFRWQHSMLYLALQALGHALIYVGVGQLGSSIGALLL